MTDAATAPLAQIPLADLIAARLTDALSPSALVVRNDSHLHAGHAGHDGSGESHFSVEIESAAFAGQSRVARQRLVNAALADLLAQRIHALAIRTRAPGSDENSGRHQRPPSCRDEPGMTVEAEAAVMRIPRPASRIIVRDGVGRVLLFRFVVDDRPPFWCLPGGALDPGESYAAAAHRELIEETGIDADPGPEIARRHVQFRTIEGVPVDADERFFHVQVRDATIDRSRHTALEQRVIDRERWVARSELADWPEPFYPEDLGAMLDELEGMAR